MAAGSNRLATSNAAGSYPLAASSAVTGRNRTMSICGPYWAWSVYTPRILYTVPGVHSLSHSAYVGLSAHTLHWTLRLAS